MRVEKQRRKWAAFNPSMVTLTENRACSRYGQIAMTRPDAPARIGF